MQERSLKNYYLLTFLLVNKHKWNGDYVETLPPFERDLYADLISQEK